MLYHSRKTARTIALSLLLIVAWQTPYSPALKAYSGKMPLALVTDGQSHYQIAIAANPSPSITLAAQEIQRYTLKATGVKLAIVNQLDPSHAGIFVGANKALPNEPRFDPATYQTERFLIDQWGKNIVIMGAQTELDPLSLRALPGNFGVLYGCYEFIERYLGVRWYAPGELGECVPSQKQILIKNLPVKQTAAYFSRTYYPWNFNENTPEESILWYRRLKGVGSKKFNPNHTMLGFGHIYPKTEPEIFAVTRDLKHRVFGSYDPNRARHWIPEPQLCLTNPRTVEIFMEAVGKWYNNSPDKKQMWPNSRPDENFIYVAPDDQFNLDQCYEKNCQAMLTPKRGYQGAMSNLVWQFVDKVARQVKDKYPGKMVGSLAYESYYLPPEDLVLPDNVIVRLCVSPYLIYFGLPEYEKRVDKTLSDWRKHVSQMSVWQYYMPYKAHPYASPYKITAWYQRYQGFITAAFIELMDTYNDPRPIKKTQANKRMGRAATDLAQVHLNMFFTMKALWGGPINVDAELEQFYALFFGPAQKPMKRYFQLTIQQWEHPGSIKVLSEQVRNPAFTSVDLYETIFNEKVVTELTNCLKQAKSLVPEDSIYAKRLQWIHDSYYDSFLKIATGFYQQGLDYWALLSTENQAVPTVDGKLNDAVWSKLPVYDFLDTRGPIKPRFATTFQMTIAQNTLYLAIRGTDPHWQEQRLVTTRRDDAVWADDSIEIFFSPDAKKPENFYQVIVNLAGQIFDRKVWNDHSDKSWTSRMISKTVRQEGQWTMELALPLDDFGIDHVQAGDSWRFNLCRNKTSSVAEQHERSQWSPTGGVFATPDLFGRLLMVAHDPLNESFDVISKRVTPGFRRVVISPRGKTTASKENFRSKIMAQQGILRWDIDFPLDKEHQNTAFLSFKLPKEGLDIIKATGCEVRFRNPNLDVSLTLTYSYIGTDGKQYSDYKRITRHSDSTKWRIRSTDFSEGYHSQRQRKKTGHFFAPPKTLTFLSLYASGNCPDKAIRRTVELDYLRVTGQLKNAQ